MVGLMSPFTSRKSKLVEVTHPVAENVKTLPLYKEGNKTPTHLNRREDTPCPATLQYLVYTKECPTLNTANKTTSWLQPQVPKR